MATKKTSNSVPNYEDNKVYEIPIREIDRESGTQPRAFRDDEYTGELAETLKSGVELPDPVVFWEASLKRLFCGDGHHRISAHLLVGHRTVKCLVRLGGRRDAFLYGCGANNTHGHRATTADKKFSYGRLLEDPELAGNSIRWFAKLFNVDPKQVQRWNKEFKPVPDPKGKRGWQPEPESPDDHDDEVSPVVEHQPPLSPTASDPFRRFTRSLDAEGIKFQSNVKTDLGMIRLVTKNAIYDVVSLLTPGSFAQAFGDLILQGSKHYPKHQKVIVGHVTEELSEKVKQAKLLGVVVKDLD